MHCRQLRGKSRRGRSWVIYDGDLVGPDCEGLFAGGVCELTGEVSILGRGCAVMFRFQGLDLVLKRYHRGGVIGRLVEHSYLFRRLEETRMWREFRLLARMYAMGLPVPRPVAAYCEKLSALTCGGELISEKIPGARSLTEILCESELPDSLWRRVGETIRTFHERQVYHADLNASNILLNSSDKVFLVDFDKSEIRAQLGKEAAEANLQRLHRSLCKLRGKHSRFHFSEENWSALEAGYRAAPAG